MTYFSISSCTTGYLKAIVQADSKAEVEAYAAARFEEPCSVTETAPHLIPARYL